MALNSNNIPLGSIASGFSLTDTISGETMRLDELKSDIATVVMFICNHCPYVKHVINGIVDLANEYIPKKIVFVAISSNDVVKYPEDGPVEMKKIAEQNNFPFPYLFDEAQEVARAYDAACTPDFYVYDSELKLVYHGQMDGARPGNTVENDGRDIRKALDSLMNNEPVDDNQIPSIGCSIKWK